MKIKEVFAILFAFSLPLQAGQTITIKGSDTMVILNQRWAESYMSKNPEIIIQVTGGGSGTGIASLISGSTDICAASRSMKAKEKKYLMDRYQSEGVETSVARDGVAVYLHGDNPIKELSLEQVKKIYLGKIKNWKDVGGKKGRIILYSRENNSGTYVFFKEKVLNKRDFHPLAQSLPGTAAVVNAIARDPRGIGYGGAAYAKGVHFCAIREEEGGPAYLPSEENIMADKYPVSRDLFFYTRKDPIGEVKKYIDWIRSPEGQKIVIGVGYFPLAK